MNNFTNDGNQIRTLENQLNYSKNLNRAKTLNEVIVIDDDDKKNNISIEIIDKSNGNVLKKYQPRMLNSSQKTIYINKEKTNNELISTLRNEIIQKNGKSINSISSIQKNEYFINYLKNSAVKQPVFNNSKISTNISIAPITNNESHLLAKKINGRMQASKKDIICLEESSSDESYSSNSNFSNLSSNATAVIKSIKSPKIDNIPPEYKKPNVITLFNIIYKEDFKVNTSTYRPMSQLLFSLGESLAQSYPYNDVDMVDFISKCAAKCKDEINYNCFITNEINTDINKEENFHNANEECSLIKSDSIKDDKPSSPKLYSLRKRPLNNYNDNLNSKKFRYDITNTKIEMKINESKEEISEKTDQYTINPIANLVNNENLYKENAYDKTEINSEIKMNNYDIASCILPLKYCECKFNTNFSTVLYEHFKHGRCYTQASCCLCGFYTPLFTKFVLHMKSEHQITVNNKIYKVTEALQCTFCKYEAYNIPTISRHMKFCNARFLKNIFAPKSDENDIPLNKSPYQLSNIQCIPTPQKPIQFILPKTVPITLSNVPIVNADKKFVDIIDVDQSIINPLNYVICPICQGTVTESLEAHMILVHNKVKDGQSKSFLCRQCSPMKVFNSWDEFDLHSLKTHCKSTNKSNNDNLKINSLYDNCPEYNNKRNTNQQSQSLIDYPSLILDSSYLPSIEDQKELKSRIDDFIKTETNSINDDKEFNERIKNEDMHAGKININSMIAGYRCDYCKVLFTDVARLEYHILRAHHRHFPSHNLLWKLLYHRAIGNCYDANELLINTGEKLHQTCSYCQELFKENVMLYRHIFLQHSAIHLTLCHWCSNFAHYPTDNYKNFLDDQLSIHQSERSIKDFTKDSITAKLGSYIDSIRRNVVAKKDLHNLNEENAKLKSCDIFNKNSPKILENSDNLTIARNLSENINVDSLNKVMNLQDSIEEKLINKELVNLDIEKSTLIDIPLPNKDFNSLLKTDCQIKPEESKLNIYESKSMSNFNSLIEESIEEIELPPIIILDNSLINF